jgi:hypothetical protein
MDAIWTQIKDVEDRLDTTITFTLVRFFYEFLLKLSDQESVFYLCFIVFLISSYANTILPDSTSAPKMVWEMFQNFSMMTFSENLTRTATGYLDASSSMHWSTWSTHLASGFALLILITVLPQTLAAATFTRRSVSLVLYMLTDSTSSILVGANFGSSTLFMCILGIAMLRQYSPSLKTDSMVHVLKLFNMIVVNMLILSIIQTDKRNSNVDVQAALLVFVVFGMDALRQTDPLVDESRNYAVWKVSQQLFVIYSRYGFDDTVLIYFSIITIFFQGCAGGDATRHASTATEVALLMAVNQILSSLEGSIASRNNSGEFTLLIFYIILIHTAQRVFLDATDAAHRT